MPPRRVNGRGRGTGVMGLRRAAQIICAPRRLADPFGASRGGAEMGDVTVTSPTAVEGGR